MQYSAVLYVQPWLISVGMPHLEFRPVRALSIRERSVGDSFFVDISDLRLRSLRVN